MCPQQDNWVFVDQFIKIADSGVNYSEEDENVLA